MSIIGAILILNFLIGIHEIGHLVFAKLCKMKVTDFSIGIGPKIWSKKIGDTNYLLRLILVGGYIKLDEEDYENVSWWKKIIMIGGGVFFNLISAYILCVLYLILNPQMSFNFIETLFYSFLVLYQISVAIFEALFNMVQNTDVSAFAGPVGVVDAINTYVKAGYLDTIELIIVLNMNLLIFNSLPLPLLDGGQILLTIIKKIFKKEKMPTFEKVWSNVGVAIIGTIFIFALVNDFKKFM